VVLLKVVLHARHACRWRYEGAVVRAAREAVLDVRVTGGLVRHAAAASVRDRPTDCLLDLDIYEIGPGVADTRTETARASKCEERRLDQHHLFQLVEAGVLVVTSDTDDEVCGPTVVRNDDAAAQERTSWVVHRGQQACLRVIRVALRGDSREHPVCDCVGFHSLERSRFL